MFRVSCPKCESELEIEDEDRDSLVECPECEKQFQPSKYLKSKGKSVPPPKPKNKPASAKPEPPPPPPVPAPAPAPTGPVGEDGEPITAYKLLEDPRPQETDPKKKQDDRIGEIAKRNARLKKREEVWETIGKPAGIMKILTMNVLCGLVGLFLLDSIFLFLGWYLAKKEFTEFLSKIDAGEEVYVYQVSYFEYPWRTKVDPPPAMTPPQTTTISRAYSWAFGASVLVMLIGHVIYYGIMFFWIGMIMTAAEQLKQMKNYNYCFIGSILGAVFSGLNALLFGLIFLLLLASLFGDSVNEWAFIGLVFVFLFTALYALYFGTCVYSIRLLLRPDVRYEFDFKPGDDDPKKDDPKKDEEDDDDDDEDDDDDDDDDDDEDDDDEDDEDDDDEEEERPAKRRRR